MSLTIDRRAGMSIGATLLLGAVWIWPLPYLPIPPFTRHMIMHMAVVAVAAPLLSLALAGGRFDPAARAPGLFSAIAASVVEMVGVWAWHAPRLHHAARESTLGLGLEQATFLLSGLYLWMAALGGQGRRAIGGVIALLLTSMHMTLLGALIALTPRQLYPSHGASALPPIVDQQLGGVVMIFVGGVVYLAGGLWLARQRLLRTPGRAAS